MQRTATLNVSDRREIARFPMELPAWISVINVSEQPNFFEAVTRDVCSKGAFIQTDQLLPVGTEVEMNLMLSLNKPPRIETRHSRIDVSGSVVRTEPQGIAICFNKNYQISPMA